MNKLIFILAFLCTNYARADGEIYLPNIPGYASGTSSGGHNGLDVNINGGTVTATNPSVGTTGSAVPASATFVGAKNGSGNLIGILSGQQTMANSLACVLASDQSAVPISAAALPLPSGAATSVNQGTEITALGTINTTLGSPFQAGGSIGNTSFGISGTLPAFAAIPAVKIDQTTPGTTNGVQVNAALPAGANVIGKVSIDQTTPGTTNRVAANLDQVAGASIATGHGTAAGSIRVELPTDGTGVVGLNAGSNVIGKVSIDQTTPGTTNLVSIGSNGTVQTKAPLNSTGSGSSAAATVSTVITLSAPANAVGAFLMNIDTSTANIRWAVNRTAAATLGQQLQPGRDVWIPTSHDISLVAESGTQTYDVQWVSQ